MSAPHREHGGGPHGARGQESMGERAPTWHASLDQAREGSETKVGLGAPLLTQLIISENWICSKSLPHPPPKNSHGTASKVGARIPN